MKRLTFPKHLTETFIKSSNSFQNNIEVEDFSNKK